jgi:branched-subunit amino acid transport protein
MIKADYFLLITVLLAFGTVFIRASFIAVASKVRISPKVRELFTFIPAAILPAIVVPANYFHHGMVDWIDGKERFVILLATSIVCYFVRNTLFIICLGLSLLYLVTRI